MFNQGVGGASRSNQASAASHNNSGSALMNAGAKIKRKQASPKVGASATVNLDSSANKSNSASQGAPQTLKYAAQAGATSQQNFLDKYGSKTRNKLGTTASAQPGPPMANNDSVSSGNGGQPAIYPASGTSRKLQSGQALSSYKAQGATSYSPKGTSSSNQAGKLLFAQTQMGVRMNATQGGHQISQAAMATAGMQGFEEATKRQEIMTQSQQHLMAVRHPSYMLQRNGGSKKELLRSEDYQQRQQQVLASPDASPSQHQQQAHGTAGGMSLEYYSRNQRAKVSKPNSLDAPGAQATQVMHAQQQAATRQQNIALTANRSKSKQGQLGVTTNFMKRRVSEEKAAEINGKMKPQLSNSRGNAIAYAEYLDQNKARSPKIYPSKHLEKLQQAQSQQMTQTNMFHPRQMAARPQVQSQTKQYQYLTNSASKSGEGNFPASGGAPGTAMTGGKSRNANVTATTSQGSLGTKQYKSQTSTKMGYALSPKAVGVGRDGQANKLKYGMKGSPKAQVSPTGARMAPSLSSQGGLFGNEAAGRNMQNSMRTKNSLGSTSAASSGTMNYLRTSGNQNMGLSPTAQYKKVLMKGPMPLMGGKVLDDNDDEEEEYESADMDEQSPQAHGHVAAMGRTSNEDTQFSAHLSPTQQREKEQHMQQRAARIQTQREQYQKQQRRLLRNIWIYTEKGNFQACYDLLVKQDPKLAQALLNECNSDGWTPLHVASNEGHVEMIDIFAQFGARLDCKAKNLRTPLHVACIRGNAHVLQALLNQGADYDAVDCDGNTPCHMISQYGHTQCLILLLEKHPKLLTRNKDDVSPMDVAYNKEILAIFQDYINRVQNIFASQQSSSKYSTSSKGSGNGSSNTGNVKDGASSKVPTSLSRPERQNSQGQIVQAQRQPQEEENKSRQPKIAKDQNQVPREAAASPSGQQMQSPIVPRQAQKPAQVSAQANKAQHKKVPIHELLNKHNDANHKKTRSHGQLIEEANSSTASNPAEDEALRVGPDDFMPLKMLGSGSFGEVYLVREIRTGDLFAMKVLTKAKIFGNNLVRYAKTERDVLSYTKHPFIVGLNYAFQTETKLFLILDFCPGGDLGRVLQREGRLSEERARKYLCEVLLAIEALHKRDIIFRDLKPDNVVIDTDGHACLTDFGLSKEGVLDPSRGAKSFCGSVAYLAPEMIRKAGHGKSVDWYLLGVILYEMIVGQPPYFSESKDQLFNNIQRGVLKLPVSMSQEAKNLIVHLLNRNPSKRLGAGAGGAAEIKGHPFFQDIDWDEVAGRRLEMPNPRYTYMQFKKQYESFNCTEEQKRQIFEDIQTQDASKTERVEGWSFVNRDGVEGVGLPPPQNVIGLDQAQVALPNGDRRSASDIGRRKAGAAGAGEESGNQVQQ